MSSPLYHACRNGDTERVRQLLDEGAPVDEKDENGRTALMQASLGGYTVVVQLLLGKGAAVGGKDKWGDTALMYASNFGRTEVAKLLLGKGDEHVTADMVQVVTNEPDERTNGRRKERRKEWGSVAWCWVLLSIPLLLLGSFGAMLHMGLLLRRGEHVIEETCTVPAQVPPPTGFPPSPSAIKWQCERHERKSGNDKSGRRLVVYIPTFTGVLMSNELECILYQGKASNSEEGCNQTAADLIGMTSPCYLEQEGSTTCYATKADSVPMTGGYIPDTEYEGDAHKERRDRVRLFRGLIQWGIIGVTLFGLCSCCTLCCAYVDQSERDGEWRKSLYPPWCL